MRPNRHTPPPKIIGATTTYHGTEHPYLRGLPVQILAVFKPIEADANEVLILKSDESLAGAGGVAVGDRVEVRPWLEEEGRWSFVTSDPRAEDLACFAHLVN